MAQLNVASCMYVLKDIFIHTQPVILVTQSAKMNGPLSGYQGQTHSLQEDCDELLALWVTCTDIQRNGPTQACPSRNRPQ